MSFKIVQTKEVGRKLPVLSIIPCAWEKEGTLLWPPVKKKIVLQKLIRDPTSKPESDWVPQPCLKKRQNFLSYQAAELELSAMLDRSDSEADGDNSLQPRLTVQKRKEAGRLPQTNFNVFAEECKKTPANAEKVTLANSAEWNNQIINQGSNEESMTVRNTSSTAKFGQIKKIPHGIDVAKQESIGPPQVIFVDHLELEENENQGEELYDEQEENEKLITVLMDNQSSVIENQKIIIENQMRLMEEMGRHSTMLEHLCENVNNMGIKISKSTNNDDDSFIKDPLPIDCIQKTG